MLYEVLVLTGGNGSEHQCPRQASSKKMLPLCLGLLKDPRNNNPMALILLIDDDSLVRETLRRVLERADHVVIEAANGSKGLAVLDTQRPDIVVTDLLMPEKEGIETIFEIRKRYSDLKIIAITGGGRAKNMDFLDMARKAGANTALAKPFPPQALLNEIAALLQG